MAPISRNKYSKKDDRLMWQYYIRRLKRKDPGCKHPSIQFWESFKQEHNWDRAASGIESHFRKILKSNIHQSGLKDVYLFTAMKKLQTRLNLMDYDELERNHNCVIYRDTKMVFKKAMRGNTELSKIPPDTECVDDDIINLEIDDRIFDTSDEDSNNGVAYTARLDRSTTDTNGPATNLRPAVNNPPPTSNPYTLMRENWKRLSMNANVPISMLPSTALNGPVTRSAATSPSTTLSRPVTRSTANTPSNAPISSRTRTTYSATGTSAQSPPSIRRRKSIQNLNRIIQKISTTRASSNVQQTVPTLANMKTALINQIRKVLNGELPVSKFEDHPLLTKENVAGFERLLEEQKLILSVLMANNNQLKFFDVDHRPTFEKRKPIPMPMIIKVERIDSSESTTPKSNATTIDDDRLVIAYESSVE